MRNKIYTRTYGGQFSASSGSGLFPFIHLVGAISNFAPNQSRPVEPIRGIGLGDRVIELVPGVSEVYTFTVDRTLFYMSCIMEAFGYNAGISGFVRALKHHKYPFDVRQELVFSMPASLASLSKFSSLDTLKLPTSIAEGDAVRCLVTIYVACWMTDYSYSVSSDNSLIAESSTISCTDITDGSTLMLPALSDGNAFASIGSATSQGLQQVFQL